MQAVPCVQLIVVACLCVAHDVCPAQPPGQAVHPKGTFVRPADGLRHAVLDQAWEVYGAAIANAARELDEVLEKRIAAAQGRGELDATVGDQALRAQFVDRGILPGGIAMRPHAIKAATAFRNANEKLLKAYEEAIGMLTREGKVDEAKAASDERGGLAIGLGFPPMPNVQESVFDGKALTAWGNGWGEGNHEVINADKAVRLTGWKCFAHQAILNGDTTFALDVRNREWERPESVVQFGFQTEAGGCLVCIPAKAANGGRLPGKGEVVHFNHVPKTNNVLLRKQFDCPPLVLKKWYSIEISRTRDRYSVVIDGKRVVEDQPLPAEVHQDYNLHLGVGDGSADFRNLTVTRNTRIDVKR